MAGNLIPSGSTIMIGGFLKCGTPTQVIDEILALPTKDLTLIANDTCVPDSDRGKLIVNKRVKKAIVSHIGTNPETGRQMHDGTLEVELVPMGTLVERIRAGGAGLGGVLTPTGVGTVIEEGKKTVEIDGKKYLLMNVPRTRLDEVVAILPGMKSPTILPLADAEWCSVHTVIEETKFWEIITRLKTAGAEGILVLDIMKMIP